MNFKVDEDLSSLKNSRIDFMKDVRRKNQPSNNYIKMNFLSQEQIETMEEIANEILSDDINVIREAINDLSNQLQYIRKDHLSTFLTVQHISKIMDFLSQQDLSLSALNILSNLHCPDFSSTLLHFNIIDASIFFIDRPNPEYVIKAVLIIGNNSLHNIRFRDTSYEKGAFHKIYHCKNIDQKVVLWALSCALEKIPYPGNLECDITQMLIMMTEGPQSEVFDDSEGTEESTSLAENEENDLTNQYSHSFNHLSNNVHFSNSNSYKFDNNNTNYNNPDVNCFSSMTNPSFNSSTFAKNETLMNNDTINNCAMNNNINRNGVNVNCLNGNSVTSKNCFRPMTSDFNKSFHCRQSNYIDNKNNFNNYEECFKARHQALKAFNKMINNGCIDFCHVILDNKYSCVLADILLCESNNKYRTLALRVISELCNCGEDAVSQVKDYDIFCIIADLIPICNFDDDLLKECLNVIINSLFYEKHSELLIDTFCNPILNFFFVNISFEVKAIAINMVQKLFEICLPEKLLQTIIKCENLITELENLIFASNYDSFLCEQIFHIFGSIYTKLQNYTQFIVPFSEKMIEIVENEEFNRLLESDEEKLAELAMIMKNTVMSYVQKEE
ncbi:hypothetical protein TRFO_10556 [Tritrichomonas foetus]|uniref:Uncharacterized protein n=1 Tax=Tritrichomonas foetus TaxID=1144522 RepID=A0A1J4J9R3_9EUKA|nr:hypothetical protein TRFO_10556 [Tritrichomonas foetus]|eukprot:OHS95409.1 hypothetical protein TRFO_10556 [Tritrichomonas foetus]